MRTPDGEAVAVAALTLLLAVAVYIIIRGMT